MKIPVIDEQTLVPMTVLAFIAGGVFWLSSLYAEVVHHTKSIEKIERIIAEYEVSRSEIIDRLARIEQKLDYVYDNKKSHK